ncbi:MAG TPA: peptidoglycan-binding domain-containing protein, partial [Candidatus Paceibacterota bacterium]|nr:peptidoglycan-binding domain-containing protein [Candidatus Paceibacterota bacterium]
LSGNTIDLRIGDGANIIAGLFTINRNSFGGTTGLDNQHATGAVTATHNWWGNATGPYNATSNSAGTGSIVSDNVTYNPWYVDAAMTSLHIIHYNGGDIGGGSGGGGGGYYPTPTATPVPTATPTPTATPVVGPVTIPILPANPTNADYQNLLNALLQQLAYLQGLVVTQQGGTTPTPAISAGYKFTVGLALGDSGEGVRQLQIFLKTQGTAIYPEGLVSGYFGSLTQKAVQRFQEKYGIAKAGDAGYGYVGPVTRAKINALQGL